MREYCTSTEFQSVQQTMDELNSRWQQVTFKANVPLGAWKSYSYKFATPR